jgi:hypothetical protein
VGGLVLLTLVTVLLRTLAKKLKSMSPDGISSVPTRLVAGVVSTPLISGVLTDPDPLMVNEFPAAAS